MQGELFPNKSRLDEFIEQKYPVLAALGIPFDRFSGYSRPYVRIRTAEGAGVYITGRGLSSQCRDTYESEVDNLIGWLPEPKDYGTEHEGFAEAVTTFRENGRAILHLLHHVTDVELSSAICLDDIEELAVYPDNAARVKAMHQNAEVDGDSSVSGWARGYSVVFTDKELKEIIDNYWPEPEIIFTRNRD